MDQRYVVAPLLGFVLVVFARPAVAREAPAVDVSGSYSFVRSDIEEGNIHGWVGSLTAHVHPVVGITGEVGGNHTAQFRVSPQGPVEDTLSLLSFLVGPRFTLRRHARVTPYAHVLIGGGIYYLSNADGNFALQGGGGLDLWFRRRVAIRVGGDVRREYDDDEHTDWFRVQIGIVLASGPG